MSQSDAVIVPSAADPNPSAASAEPQKWEPGDEVYSQEGQLGIYQEPTASGKHVVKPCFRDEEEGWTTGMPEIWPAVYLNPPVPILHKKVTDLKTELRMVKQDIEKARKERSELLMGTLRAKEEAETEAKRLVERLKKNRALKRIDDYLEGKFAYFVYLPAYYPPKIMTMKDALTEEERNGKVKLLSLFGDSDGDLEWRINQYSVGRGDWFEAVPCESEKEAIEIIRDRYAKYVEEWRKLDSLNKDRGTALNWSRQCPPGMIEIPDDIRDFLRESEQKRHQKAVDEARAAVTKAEAALAVVLAGSAAK